MRIPHLVGANRDTMIAFAFNIIPYNRRTTDEMSAQNSRPRILITAHFMFKWLRNLRISLAAKCQILFGAAVVLIIGAALYVPWRRMDDLILMVNLQTAEGLASQAKMEHIARERQISTAKSAAPIPATRRAHAGGGVRRAPPGPH